MKKQLHPLRNLDGHMNTVSGVRFNLLEPTPDMIEFRDISAGLAFNAHFNGQSPQFFSVAQHSMMVHNLALEKTGNPELAIVGLMHDAAEAYLGDLIAPLKIMWPGYRELESKVLTAIFEKFGLNMDLMRDIKEFDLEIQEQEYEQFYKGVNHFHYLAPNAARATFTVAFYKAKQNFSDYLKRANKRKEAI